MMLHGVASGSLSPENFERNLSWLGRHFNVVSLSTLIKRQHEHVAPAGEIAITFDDGLGNHAKIVYPILKKLQLPATFFVCPGLMERREWLWNHEARARLLTLSAEGVATLARSVGAPATGVESVIAWMKTLTLDNRRATEGAICRATPRFVATAHDRIRFDALTLEELDALDPNLITIGSHTMNHPILPELDDAALEYELTESRRFLEKRLGRAVDLFCYPNGTNDTRVKAAVAKTYRAAVTTELGFVRLSHADLHGLPRIGMPESVTALAWRMWRNKQKVRSSSRYGKQTRADF